MRNLIAVFLLRYVFEFAGLIPCVHSEPFNPSVHCHCADGRMTIIVHTDLPFKGVAYTAGHRSTCYWLAEGAQDMKLAIRLGGSECGVTYNQAAEDYHVILYVRQHPTIILEQDRAFNMSCSNPRSSSAAQLVSDETSTVGLSITNRDGAKTHDTVFGDSYLLKVSLSEGSNFLVTTCQAFAGDYSSTLIDGAGCSSDPSIISNIRYSETGRVGEATINAMFRFPNVPYVHIQCGVMRCNSLPCSKPNCDRRRDEPIGRNMTRGREGLASTTVKVLDVGNMTEILYEPPCSFHYSALSWTCIIAGVIFIIIACIHMAFCLLYGGRDAFDSHIVNEPAVLVSAHTTDSEPSKVSLPDRWYH